MNDMMNKIMDILKKPVVMVGIALVIGVFLGLWWGWAVQPVVFVDAPVDKLRDDLRTEYLRMALDSFRVNGNMELALGRYDQLGVYGPKSFTDIQNDPRDTDPGVIAIFAQALQDRATQPGEPTPVPTDNSGGGGGNTAGVFAIIIISVIVIGLVGAAAFWLLRSNHRAPEDMTPAMVAAEHSRSVEKTDYSTSGTEPPVAQYVTTYVLGDDLFDDSFSIDAPSGEFLGECGVGISETVGVGDPKKVAAFEVWMFDKNDIQTVTKVLMSARAFADPGFRAKLEPKGELVQVDPHKQVVLETQTLQMIATVSDMQYGQGALPDGSYFDRVTIELAIWSKK